MNENQIALIIEAQEAQIANPKRTPWSSESSHVFEALKSKDSDTAYMYWDFFMKPNLKVIDHPQVIANQKILNDIFSTVTMPDWGYSRT